VDHLVLADLQQLRERLLQPERVRRDPAAAGRRERDEVVAAPVDRADAGVRQPQRVGAGGQGDRQVLQDVHADLARAPGGEDERLGGPVEVERLQPHAPAERVDAADDLPCRHGEPDVPACRPLLGQPADGVEQPLVLLGDPAPQLRPA
jgi:hypothetical protein